MYYFNFSYAATMLEQTLHTVLGLSANAIAIFLTTLQNGPTPASTLAKRCNLARHTTYQIIEGLQARGFMGFTIKNNVRYFAAIDPEILLERCETEIMQAKNMTQKVVMLLEKITPQYTKPAGSTVTFCLEGRDGIKSLYSDVLKEGKPYLNFSYGLPLFEVDPDAYYYFHHKRIKKNITVKKIMPVPQNPIHDPEKIHVQLLDVRYLPHEKFSLPGDIHIYGNKIALIDGNKELPHIIMIESPTLARLFENIFMLSWETAEKYKRIS